VSKKKIDYVSRSNINNNNWFLYSYIQKDQGEEGNPLLTKQKLMNLNLANNRIKTIANLKGIGNDDDQEYIFEISGGYAWMLDYCIVESGSYSCWEKIKVN
jgi:hypothetical protein